MESDRKSVETSNVSPTVKEYERKSSENWLGNNRTTHVVFSRRIIVSESESQLYGFSRTVALRSYGASYTWQGCNPPSRYAVSEFRPVYADLVKDLHSCSSQLKTITTLKNG